VSPVIYGQWSLTKDVPVPDEMDAWLNVLWEIRALGRTITDLRALQRRDLDPKQRPHAWLRIPPPWLEGK